jgi:uncharacterized surface protein with fasciclin (FAS1) repeats
MTFPSHKAQIQRFDMKIAACLSVFFALPAISSAQACQSIVEIASGNDDFSTLVAALGAADLVGALEGDGPFTVFAPTNQAFENLPDGTLNTLLKPESKAALSGILLYHVLGKQILSKNFENTRYKTLQGTTVRIRTHPFKVNRSNVVTADIKACNGVIHVIDQVLLPSAPAPAPVSSPPRIKDVGMCSNSKPCGLCQGTFTG